MIASPRGEQSESTSLAETFLEASAAPTSMSTPSPCGGAAADLRRQGRGSQDYSPGAPKAFGSDVHATFFDDWLRFCGIIDIHEVRFQPTVITGDPAGAARPPSSGPPAGSGVQRPRPRGRLTD